MDEVTHTLASTSSIINEVQHLGFDLRRVTFENAGLISHYAPTLMQRIADMAAELEHQRNVILKSKVKRAEAAERERLLGVRSKGEGPGGVRLDVDTIRFLCTRSETVLKLNEMAADLELNITKLWNYHKSLQEANMAALAYHGRMRAETGLGWHQHRTDQDFTRDRTLPGFNPPSSGEHDDIPL